jgi:hypothetical protein
MHLRSFFFVFLLLSLPCSSQTLQGVVTDSATHKPLVAVTVVNLKTQASAYTDANGYYSLFAKQGEVIVFSYIGYKTVRKAMPPSVLLSTMNIELEKVVYELDEVVMRPGLLTQYQIDSTERAEIYKIPLGRRRPTVMSPVSALAEKFSKKAKSTYRFQQVFAAGEVEKFVDTRYTPALVTSLTGITGDSIGYFMHAFPMPYDFARAATNLEMKMWIRDNYKQWIAGHAADSVHVLNK